MLYLRSGRVNCARCRQPEDMHNASMPFALVCRSGTGWKLAKLYQNCTELASGVLF